MSEGTQDRWDGWLDCLVLAIDGTHASGKAALIHGGGQFDLAAEVACSPPGSAPPAITDF